MSSIPKVLTNKFVLTGWVEYMLLFEERNQWGVVVVVVVAANDGLRSARWWIISTPPVLKLLTFERDHRGSFARCCLNASIRSIQQSTYSGETEQHRTVNIALHSVPTQIPVPRDFSTRLFFLFVAMQCEQWLLAFLLLFLFLCCWWTKGSARRSARILPWSSRSSGRREGWERSPRRLPPWKRIRNWREASVPIWVQRGPMVLRTWASLTTYSRALVVTADRIYKRYWINYGVEYGASGRWRKRRRL